MIIRKALPGDLLQILELYRQVASVPGGLARNEIEINEGFISTCMQSSADRGFEFVAIVNEASGQVAGEIHCWQPEPGVFSHVLSSLTVAIHPMHQGKQIGRALFTHLLHHIEINCTSVLRVELIARESNQRAIQFYESLGFKQEGRFEKRIRNHNNQFEADIPMAWMNPCYKET